MIEENQNSITKAVLDNRDELNRLSESAKGDREMIKRKLTENSLKLAQITTNIEPQALDKILANEKPLPKLSPEDMVVKKTSFNQWDQEGAKDHPLFKILHKRPATAIKRVWTSRPHLIEPGPVDLESDTFDVASIVNQYTELTGVEIPIDDADAFNKSWRKSFLATFEALHGGKEDTEDFLKTGQSHGYPMRLQLMALPPHTWFRCHAHPNLEFEHTLSGSLHEVRLTNLCMAPGSLRDDQGRPIPPGTQSGDYGPNLAEIKDSVNMDFEIGEVEEYGYLGNARGSVHQSFTGKEGAILLLLWSGCHANIRPLKCKNVHKDLRPFAGWQIKELTPVETSLLEEYLRA